DEVACELCLYFCPRALPRAFYQIAGKKQSSNPNQNYFKTSGMANRNYLFLLGKLKIELISRCDREHTVCVTVPVAHERSAPRLRHPLQNVCSPFHYYVNYLFTTVILSSIISNTPP